MDALLARFGVQAVNYAIRSGIALTSSYAIGQCSRLLKTVNDSSLRQELKSLQSVLNSKIKIISPAIDLIEFKSGRGNVFLESAVPLAKSLHRDIVVLGKELEDAAAAEEDFRLAGAKAQSAERHHVALALIIKNIQCLLARIDRDIPLIQLAISASGESLSTSMPPGVSPSRLLQASAFLNFADMQYANNPGQTVQVGPALTLSLYMLFLGHSSQRQCEPSGDQYGQRTTVPVDGTAPQTEQSYGFGEGERMPIWQEVIHKARTRLCRTPVGWTFDRQHGYVAPARPAQDHEWLNNSALDILGQEDGYAYHLECIEDLDDGRAHEDSGQTSCAYGSIPLAGIRESIPIHQFSKIFYTDTGRILNMGSQDERGGNSTSPVLLFKRDIDAPNPRDVMNDILNGQDANSLGDDCNEIVPDEQNDIDRQLREESEVAETSTRTDPLEWQLPRHLDPEWLAFEVFVEDDDDDDGSSEKGDTLRDEGTAGREDTTPVTPPIQHRSSLDDKLLAEINRLSLRSSSASHAMSRSSSGDVQHRDATSPFGTIKSSLSLMEMLVRLTCLQEFQQTSHLSIPDQILTFFLEETSTTGLQGEAKWNARNEAKRRMGFDPYTDTPTK